MSRGCYTVSMDSLQASLKFLVRHDVAQEIPEDQQELIFEIGKTLSVLKLIYPKNSNELNFALKQLYNIGKVGLEGDYAQPQFAFRAIEQLKAEVTNKESGRLKTNYLKRLGVFALIPLLFFISIGSYMNLVSCYHSTVGCVHLNIVANLFILLAGTMVGIWLSFAISRVNVEFEDIAILDKDRLEPSLRIIFTGILSLVFGLLVYQGAFIIKIGEFDFKDLVADPVSAFLLGVVLGVNEKLLGSKLVNSTRNFFKS